MQELYSGHKGDLKEEWEVDDRRVAELRANGLEPVVTSAKTGAGVESVYRELTVRMLAGAR